MMRKAYSTDGYQLRYRRLLQPIVQVYALHAPPSPPAADAPGGRLLVVFAVPGSGFTPGAGIMPGRVAYPLHFRVTAMTTSGKNRVELDTVRTFVAPRPLEGREHLSGTVELALPAGRYDVRVRIESPDSAGSRDGGYESEIIGGAGAVAAMDSVVVPAAMDDRVVLGDVVLGQEGAGRMWASPDGPVPLNPLNAYETDSNVELFYEATGLQRGAEFRTRIRVWRAGSPAGESDAAVAFNERALSSRQAFRRNINLAGLSSGRYLLSVAIEMGGKVLAERTSTLNVVGE